MIVDRTGAELIKAIYDERKAIWEHHHPEVKWEKNPDLLTQYYTETFVGCMGTMGRMVQYVGFDADRTYRHWLDVMYKIIDMCILAGKEPQYALPENYIGYGFVNFQHCQRELHVLHHMERMLNALTLGYEPLWWIELGNETGITYIKL